jgi:hypothetical protein
MPLQGGFSKGTTSIGKLQSRTKVGKVGGVSALESIINLKLLYFGEKMGNYKAWSWTVPRPGVVLQTLRKTWETRLRDMRIEAKGQICREVFNNEKKDKDSINQNRIYYLLND